MKLSKALLIATSSLAFCSAVAANANFSLSSQLITDVGLTNTQELTFPEHTVTGAATTLTVDANAATAAKFDATGEAGRTATFSVANTTTTLTCTSGACTTSGTNTIDVNNFTGTDESGNGSAPLPRVLTIPASGNMNNIGIGATENIVADNAAGIYTGTEQATLAYQ